MPVYLDPLPPGLDTLRRSQNHSAAPRVEQRSSPTNGLEIGIINNMPDGALQSTERQFAGLLDDAAGSLPIRLTFYALPDLPRSGAARRRVASYYSSIDELWSRRLDGLIVTGAEPRSPNLAGEPYWDSLTRVLEWAEHNTCSSLWSCLAAHAAVLYLDGIHRRPLREKRCGVFSCDPASLHPLMPQAPAPLHMPHSRWNELSGSDLAESGYQILTRSEHAGVDAFVKQRNSLFVFFQGHPEYDANTLLLEYRRDIARYLRGEREIYPRMPQGYFDAETRRTLTALRERAERNRRESILAGFPTALVERTLVNVWRPAASGIYRNWLMYLSARKSQGRVCGKIWEASPRGMLNVSRRFAAGGD